jgi:hypothetical protein
MRTKLSLKGRTHSHELGIDGSTTLKWIFGKDGLGCGLDSSGSEWRPVVGSCEHDNEHSGPIKGE